jgi:hypothetical protein
VDPTTGGLTNIDAMPSEGPAIEKFLAEGKIFQGGNAQILHKLLQLSAGDKLLYVGDRK